MEETQLSGNRYLVENRGSGIRAMLEAIRRANLELPRFQDKRSSFWVTFRNHTPIHQRGEGVRIILENSEQLAHRRPEYRLFDDAELLLTIFAAGGSVETKPRAGKKAPKRRSGVSSKKVRYGSS
jgi:predicted HTH transcriptional regulator